MKLNIGCGNKKIEGFTGIDKFDCAAVDIICDVENAKLPFDDNTVDEIMSKMN